MRDSEAVEKARRGLGEQLAAYRRAAGYSQAALASLVAYSRSTVANVETGRQHVPRDFWERADAALQTGGTLRRASDDVDAAARREREAAARAERERRAARAEQWRISHANDLAQRQTENLGWPETIGDTKAAAAAVWSEDESLSPPMPDRASALAAETLALRWLVAPGDVSLERPDGWRRITPGDLARLSGMRRCLKDMDNAHGGGAALPMALSYVRHELPLLLEGRYNDRTGRALFEIAAEFQQDLGWMAYDSGQQNLASHCFAHALRFSHAAGNRLLGGRILAAMSHQAIYLGRIRQGVDLARAARAGTQHLATPRAAAMLAAMEACAHAAAGDARQCRVALADAENAMAAGHEEEPEPDWLDFDEGGCWGHAARAYRDLGEPQRAEPCAEKSVTLCLAAHSRTRAQRTAIQATVLAAMGEVDAAAAVGERTVREAWNLHSGHVFGDVAALVQLIEPCKARGAGDFLEQARELLAARVPSTPARG